MIVTKYVFIFWNRKAPVLILPQNMFPSYIEYLLSLPSAQGAGPATLIKVWYMHADVHIGAVAIGIAFMATESVISRTFSIIKQEMTQ